MSARMVLIPDRERPFWINLDLVASVEVVSEPDVPGGDVVVTLSCVEEIASIEFDTNEELARILAVLCCSPTSCGGGHELGQE
jgi:hypothetical protein